MSVVSLQGVSKRYRIFPSQKDQLKSILTLGRHKAGRDFWALENIDLEVERGTVLGIVGRNGAGKTTLLKIVSGVLQPTGGTARVDGRLVALLQLGAGFNDDFTGRENIMLNGLILGIERKEMLRRLDEIEAFADIGEFVDQPLKTYSSGMRARLGFAVAVNVEPDVLLVDEALSTGDALFKAKGMQKMLELRDSGTTILFVSHSKTQVKDFCNDAILLNKGRLISRGDTGAIMDEYKALLVATATRRDDSQLDHQPPDYEVERDDEDGGLAISDFKQDPALEKSSDTHHGTGEARIQSVEVLDDRGRPVEIVTPEQQVTIRAHVQYAEEVEDSLVDITLRNKNGLEIFSTNTNLEKTPVGKRSAGERVIVDFTFEVPLMKEGSYNIATTVKHTNKKGLPLDWVGVSAVFKVLHSSYSGGFRGLAHLPTRARVFEPDGTLRSRE